MSAIAEAIYIVAWLTIIGLVAGWVICLAIGALELTCALITRLMKSAS